MRILGVMDDHTFSKLAKQIRSNIRSHKKWAVSLVIAYGHFNLPQGLVWYVWVNILTFITLLKADPSENGEKLPQFTNVLCLACILDHNYCESLIFSFFVTHVN